MTSESPKTKPSPSYVIEWKLGYRSIVCLLCNRRSYNRNDIDQRYCGFCHIFHED